MVPAALQRSEALQERPVAPAEVKTAPRSVTKASRGSGWHQQGRVIAVARVATSQKQQQEYEEAPKTGQEKLYMMRFV